MFSVASPVREGFVAKDSVAAGPTVATLVSQPATAAATATDPIAAVTGVVSNLFRGFLNPLDAGNGPGAPTDSPALWSLLAFARREFETALAPPALTGVPVNGLTTGQTLVADTQAVDLQVPAVDNSLTYTAQRGQLSDDGAFMQSAVQPSAQPEQRTLILSAFPAEADAVLARTTLDPNPSVVVDGHHYYLGTLGGKKVIVAMTGIGMVNATDTTETALDYFTPESGTSIDAVVFSGVAGGFGRTEIGDVAVPARWTSDDGATWNAVDAGMLAAASALTVDLESTDSIIDPACGCGPLTRLLQVDLKREPELFVGGDGSSDDNNNGVAFPEIPLGGSIFGPQPLSAPDRSLLFTGNFFQAIGPFLAQGLISNLTGLFATDSPQVDAVDQETAAAQQVAEAHGIPFLGIRGMSDGPGDPLNLPGYPFTFFVYNQIAADNAAIVTEAFLRNWAGPDAAL